MPLAAGIVTIAADGTETPSGLAAVIYSALKTNVSARFVPFGQTFPTGAASVPAKQGLADMANAIATGLVPYLVANVAVSITVPTNAFGAGVPAAPVVITGTIT